MQSCFIFIITRFRLVLYVYINITQEYIEIRAILWFWNIAAKNCILDKIIDFGQTKTSIFDYIIVGSLLIIA